MSNIIEQDQKSNSSHENGEPTNKDHETEQESTNKLELAESSIISFSTEKDSEIVDNKKGKRSRTRKCLRRESLTAENQSIINFGDNFFDEEEKSQLISENYNSKHSGEVWSILNNSDEGESKLNNAEKDTESMLTETSHENKPIDEILDHLKYTENASEIIDYANDNYGDHKTNDIFNKKQISKYMLISFTNELITEPLHKNLSKHLHKLSLECFKCILKYMDVLETNDHEKQIDRIISILYENNDLIDEVYCQLMKQSTHTPSNLMLEKSMKLFIVISSIFPASENVRSYVKTFLIQISKHPDLIITAFSEFALIRFFARCYIGRVQPKEELSQDYVKNIFMQLSMGCQVFGISVYEMMWNQRTKYPNLPIPYIEYHFTRHILEKGGASQEGLFRISGRMTEVRKMIETFNTGVDAIQSDTSVNDICSTFKAWFREMPIPIVQPDKFAEITTVGENEKHKYIEYAESLLKAHKNVLKFLIGFLQNLVIYKEATRMDAKNLSIVFGPNIVQYDEESTESDIKITSDAANGFLQYLIENWDTSDIYPLQEKHFQ